MATMRAFVVVGRKANATGTFRLEDIAGTSGRIDVLLRCLRAALLTSHGLRRDVTVYLVFESGPRVLRVDGSRVRFLRPDERALAVLAQKVLAPEATDEWTEVRPGIALVRGGLERALVERRDVFVLDATSTRDVREVALPPDATIVLGDHLGLSDDARARLASAMPLTLGPMNVHADDAIAIVSNELDRRYPPAG